MNITPENITELAADEIFVFGSNTEGRHGKGAALIARQRFGAVYGVGVGLTGRCYAIPTRYTHPELRTICSLPYSNLQPYIWDFLRYARAHPEYKFLVTKIGCGLGGFTPAQIAGIFRSFADIENDMPNVWLPIEFWRA